MQSFFFGLWQSNSICLSHRNGIVLSWLQVTERRLKWRQHNTTLNVTPFVKSKSDVSVSIIFERDIEEHQLQYGVYGDWKCFVSGRIRGWRSSMLKRQCVRIGQKGKYVTYNQYLLRHVSMCQPGQTVATDTTVCILQAMFCFVSFCLVEERITKNESSQCRIALGTFRFS